MKKTNKSEGEPEQTCGDWSKSGLLFYSKTFEFRNNSEISLFLLDVLQMHNNDIGIQATNKPDQQVEVVLVSKEEDKPCDRESYRPVMDEIEHCFNEHK